MLGGWSPALFLGAAAAAFLLYVCALALLSRRPADVRLVLAVACAIQLVPLAGPLLLSRDVYGYWAYGRIAAIHHANPYRLAPARFPADPATRAMAGAWRRERSVYGPVFTGASEVVAKTVGTSLGAAAFVYRVAAALGMLALVGLAALHARKPALAAAAVGWNPLFAIHFAGGGHNDVWMLVPVLGALVLEERGRRVAAGICWALAVSVKWIVLVLLPLQLLARRGARTLAGFVGAAAVIALAVTWAFGFAWLHALAPVAHRRSAYSLPSRLEQAGLGRTAALAVCGSLLLAGLAALALQASRGRARLGLGAILILLASPWLLPWYAVWALPLAAAEEDTTALWLAVALSAYLLPDRISF